MARKYNKEYYMGLTPFVLCTTDRKADRSGWVIGFSDEFYTLYHAVQTGDRITYCYKHNISKSAEFVAGLSLSIDENLRGIKRNFTRTIRISESGVFNFGKYYGKPIADCDDIEYLKWYFNTGEDSENADLIVARVTELDPDIFLWYPDKDNYPYLYEWRSRSEMSEYDIMIKKMRSGEITLPLDEINNDGIMVVAAGDRQVFFKFPYKEYAGSYYRRPYGLILNPKNGKPITTKGRDLTVDITKMTVLDNWESADGFTYNNPIGMVEKYEIIGLPEKKRKLRKQRLAEKAAANK